jgi:murein DD-endopeptidase MepM/ murein hydrolase activator NlpD
MKRIVISLIIFFSIISVLFLSYKFISRKAVVKEYKSPFISKSGSFNAYFETELKKNLDSEETAKIINAYRKKLDFKKINENDRYNIFYSTDNKFKYIEVYKKGSIYSVFKKGDKYIYSYKKDKISSQEFNLSGEIKDNLWNSMISKNIPPEIILDFTEIFSSKIDFFTEVRNNDKFKIFYKLEKDSTGAILSYEILASMYEGSETGKNYAFKYLGNYYDENGKGLRGMFLKAPLNYKRISSYFTYHRFHPVLKYVRPHLGIDYAAPSGTPVSSVADGVIVYKGWNGGYGNFIEIKHRDSYNTTYGHLLKFAKGIYIGKRVKQGDLIGYVGMTGIATGPHLDFRIKHNGVFLNYLKIKNKATLDLSKKYLDDFKEYIKRFF